MTFRPARPVLRIFVRARRLSRCCSRDDRARGRRGQTEVAQGDGVACVPLELQRELSGNEIFACLQRFLLAEAVLEFPLQVIREAIAEGGVDAPDIAAPLRAVILVPDCAEELLVPAERPKKLRSDLVFRLEIVGK